MHPITNQSSTLERLCIGLMLGDKLLQLAKAQQAAYTAARHRYNMPRLILRNASIGLGLASTIVAISVPDGGSYGIAEDGHRTGRLDGQRGVAAVVGPCRVLCIHRPAGGDARCRSDRSVPRHAKALNACERAAGS